MLRIGLLTSGGDCQALNATMRGVVKGLANNVKDLEVYGFMNGYKGLIYSDYGFSSAIGLFTTSFNIVLLLTVNKIAKKISDTSLF